jgi:hypothetical protein
MHKAESPRQGAKILRGRVSAASGGSRGARPGKVGNARVVMKELRRVRRRTGPPLTTEVHRRIPRTHQAAVGCQPVLGRRLFRRAAGSMSSKLGSMKSISRNLRNSRWWAVQFLAEGPLATHRVPRDSSRLALSSRSGGMDGRPPAPTSDRIPPSGRRRGAAPVGSPLAAAANYQGGLVPLCAGPAPAGYS